MTRIALACGIALAAGLAGCELDVPDLNNPGLEELEEEPTPSAVNAACTGLLIGHRVGTAAANGYVSQLGILGREAYNFDPADPRYVGELLIGELQPGSPFGGNFWTVPYSNIRLADIILRATEQVAEFSVADKAAIRGFTLTIKAMDLLRVISTRDSIGAVVDTDRPVGDLGPIVGRAEVLAAIADLLDDASTDLMMGGDAFPFPLSQGFSGFDTPATFERFNRALRARVAAYQGDYDGILAALAGSFLDDTATTQAELDAGVYHSFSTGSGDLTNGLNSPNIFVHPSVSADAQSNGATPDLRLTAKVGPAAEGGSAQGLSSDEVFLMYTSPGASVPIIRNEELLLLRAEAAWGNGDLGSAKSDLDQVRAVAGGLGPIADSPDADAIEDEILYNRRYSLLFEGGHRWIDLRRFGRVDDLPLDLDDHVRNVRYPLPSAECDGRVGDPACEMGSQ